jgi:hypothetical protein
MSLLGLAAIAGWAGVGLLLLLWRSFLPAYLNKKAENFATHEDINKLVDQVQAVTTATEQIKAKISNEIWDRQKQWELKREMIIEISKAISEIEEAMLRVKSVLSVRDESQEWRESYREGLTKWRDASALLDRDRMLVDISCSDNTAMLVGQYAVSATNLCSQMTKKQDVQGLRRCVP